MSSNIRKTIKKGEKNIEVRIVQGVFYYDRLPVYLYNIDAKDVSISVIGNNSILVAGGRDYQNGKTLSLLDNNNVFLDEKMDLIDPYEEVEQSIGQVEVLNETTKECRIAINNEYQFKTGMKIQISEWFHSPVYEVTKVSDGFVYFIAHDLIYDEAKKCYNVHYDNVVGEMNPRYRVYNPHVVSNYNKCIHECEVSLFLTLYKSKLKSFSMSGIEFRGCAKGKNALCYFRDVDAEEIHISDCHFMYMNQRIVKVNNTANFVFDNNIVSNCYYGAVYSYMDSPNTIVKNNHFFRLGRGWTNCSAVTCLGMDFLVNNNSFEDIGYSSISSGYKRGDKMVSRGVIENNEIWFGDDYYNHCEKYTLIDGGAIYISTLNDQVIIRYNYVHDYRGVGSNRAIYCDDGAMNVKIYGNVISGVTNANSVLSWRAKSINKKFPQSNDGIDFYYNVIWGRYKLDERLNSSCVHGKNLILCGEGEQAPESILKNFAYREQDVVFSGAAMVNGKITMPKAAMDELKRFPTYPKMKQWFE